MKRNDLVIHERNEQAWMPGPGNLTPPRQWGSVLERRVNLEGSYDEVNIVLDALRSQVQKSDDIKEREECTYLFSDLSKKPLSEESRATICCSISELAVINSALINSDSPEARKMYKELINVNDSSVEHVDETPEEQMRRILADAQKLQTFFDQYTTV